MIGDSDRARWSRLPPSKAFTKCTKKTPEQLAALQKTFENQTYPTTAVIRSLCESTNLDEFSARVIIILLSISSTAI